MGYIDYCIEYHNGEFWSETRPFWDLEEYEIITNNSHLSYLAEKYKAKQVLIVGVRMNEHQYHGTPTVEGLVS